MTVNDKILNDITDTASAFKQLINAAMLTEPDAAADAPREVTTSVILQLAQRHGLVYALKNLRFSGELQQQLNKKIQIQALKSRLLERQIVELSACLKSAGITHAFVKGPAAVKQFYRDIHFYRSAVDIDVLVASSDIPIASQVLLSAGYRYRLSAKQQKIAEFVGRYEHWYRFRDIGFNHHKQHYANIDLHWRLMDSFTVPFDTNKVLANREQVSLNGANIPVLGFTEHFIFVCMHAYVDRFFMAKQLVDIYSATQHPRFDKGLVLMQAEQLGVSRQIQESLQTVDLFFNKSTDMDNIHPESFAHKVWQRYICHQFIPPRSHPNKSVWSKADKRAYLKHQISNRSTKASRFSPIIARMKYDETMLASWSNRHPLVDYPQALFARFLR